MTSDQRLRLSEARERREATIAETASTASESRIAYIAKLLQKPRIVSE